MINFPLFINILKYAYGTDSTLLFGHDQIASSEGVQQGDPLGPFLFAITLHTLIDQLESDLNCWYLDDGTLLGEPSVVEENFRGIVSEGERMGL